MKTDVTNQLYHALKNKEHIIWDWNGTLLDDVGHCITVMNHLLEEHQLPLLDKERYRNIFEFPVFLYYQNLGFDFTKESFESLCHRFVDRFMMNVWDLPLVPEMRPFLLELHQKKRVQSILSATDQTNLDSMIAHFKLNDIFSFVFGINNKMAASKLERGHELISTSGIEKEKTVIIGDTLHDLDVGRALGIDVILLSHGHQSTSKLLAHYDVVI